jgi:OOP family OmpA-OmpF porin
MTSKYAFVVAFTLLFCSLTAQYSGPRSGVTFRKVFVDYQSQQGGNVFNFNEYRHGYEIGYHRVLNYAVSLSAPVRFGAAQFLNDTQSDRFKTQQFISADLQASYNFNIAHRKIFPYVLAGAGAVYELQGDVHAVIPAGLGFMFKLHPNAWVNIQSEFRYAFKDNRNNLQHGVGFTYLFGKAKADESKKDAKQPDSDNDGIPDDLDLCPNAFGSKELNGCPDRDEDGVPDYADTCPEIVGKKEFGGCPDSDNDGVPDNEDECPKLSGVKANKGCPEVKKEAEKPLVTDTDGDGVEDNKDRCPDQKGPAATGGCPDKDGDGVPDMEDKCPDKKGLRIYYGCPDTDNDGIDDSRDKCPDLPGTVAAEGCPEIRKEDKRTLEVAMQAVQFQSGSAVLKPESGIVLSQIANIMMRYPDFNMNISGHTDDVGSEVTNQTLSEKRARACYDYIIKEGIAPSRLSYTGFGESRPISDNRNDKGRSLNRRVEFNMVPRN